MNIFAKIKQQNFTSSERSITDYILEFPQEIAQLDIKELAQKCYVSTSTVYRFLDKLELQ